MSRVNIQDNNEQLPSCYPDGYQFNSESCRACKWRKWCEESNECNRVVFANDKEYDLDQIKQEAGAGCYDDRRYSSVQVVNLARLLCSMRKDIQELVLSKLEMPKVSLSELADKRKISKQAIHKAFVSATKQFPELAEVLHNKPGYNSWRG